DNCVGYNDTYLRRASGDCNDRNTLSLPTRAEPGPGAGAPRAVPRLKPHFSRQAHLPGTVRVLRLAELPAAPQIENKKARRDGGPFAFHLFAQQFRVSAEQQGSRRLLQRADIVHRLVEMNMGIDVIDPAHRNKMVPA